MQSSELLERLFSYIKGIKKRLSICFDTLLKINYKEKLKGYFNTLKSINYKEIIIKCKETIINYKNSLIKIFKDKVKPYLLSKFSFEKLSLFIDRMERKTVFSISAAVLAFFIISSAVACDLSFGYSIVCENKTVAFSHSRSAAKKAYINAMEELKKINPDESEKNVKIRLAIANNELFQSDDFIKNAIVACYDGRQDGYGIFADGNLIVALNSNEEALEALQRYKESFSTENAQSVSFNRNVEIKPARVSTYNIKSTDEAINVFAEPKGGIAKHKVEEGETISHIALKYNTTSDKLLKLNPDVKPETMQIGREIIVTDTTPVLAVKVTEQIVEREKIAFKVNEIKDNTTYKGVSVVLKEGKQGEKEVTYDIVKENGIITSKVAVSEIVLQEPVTKEVKIGSKERPATHPTGTFAMPYYGVLTSRYGSRGRGFHTGIDLAGSAGSPVYASDGGTVIFAGWSGGYGKLIKIKHDNGYETYYAHLSSINVSVGQKVAKKEFIGRVGSTGNSTGSHLHFEIRRNGTALNPYSYLR